MYRLYHSPDTAATIVRLVLEELGQPHELVPVDTEAREHDGVAYRRVNPAGLLPALETPDGTLAETAAILLWLSERHGRLAPAPGNRDRAVFLKWLVFASNTLQADARILFHPEYYIGPDPAAQASLRAQMAERLARHLTLLDAMGMADRPGWFNASQPSVLTIHVAMFLRWLAVYPADHCGWFRLTDWPCLQGIAERMDRRAAAQRVAAAEGLGAAPFSAPALIPATAS